MSFQFDDDKQYDVLLKHRPLKNTLGIIDHWFVEVVDFNLEIHMGNYSKGTHLPSNSTNHAHTFLKIKMCKDCVDHLLRHTVELDSVFYYPIINCETLASKNCCVIGISVQTVFITSIIIFACLSIFKFYLFYVALVLLIVFIIYSKYIYCITFHRICKHLKNASKN